MEIAQIHTRLRSHKMFTVFTWLTRFLLALAFIPSGLKKVLGLRFTTIGIEDPVGFFFEALYRTGFYWNFLGVVQLAAALFLLIPRTSYLGAIIYLPLVINICVIVTAMNFVGTPIVASLMLLGNLYLFLWDYPKSKILARTVVSKI